MRGRRQSLAAASLLIAGTRAGQIVVSRAIQGLAVENNLPTAVTRKAPMVLPDMAADVTGGVAREQLQGANAMQLHVNPHELILVGENSFLRLSTDGSQTASTRCSHWRVLWSPAGAGHALFVESGVVGGVRVYSDSVPLVRFLQQEIEHLLYKPFGDASLPVLAATFERDGTPPGGCSEIVRPGGEEIRLSWSEFLEPFNFSADPGYDGRPIGVQTTFIPAARALLSVSGRNADGEPWKMDRGGKPCTSACLAWCETWFRPR